MSAMLDWLRSTIQGDLAAAKAADQASPGPWVNTGQAGDGDAWQIHGALTADSETEWDEEKQDVVNIGIRVATLNFSDGGGVWKREAADHIVLQQPRDTIARCESDLALLDEHEPIPCSCVKCQHPREGYATETVCMSCSSKLWPCRTIRLLASGRRHREGFNPDWVSG